MDTHYVNYNLIHVICMKIVCELNTLFLTPNDIIGSTKKQECSLYGIPRGGLIPAVLISHRTGIPITTNIEEANKIIFVDDLLDSGDTFKFFHSEAKEKFVAFVALGYKDTPTASEIVSRPDVIAPKKWKKDKWIHFCWEA